MQKNETEQEKRPEPPEKPAPGWPGIRPTWAPAAKSGVGCALSAQSNLWFTLGRGIANEIYDARIDHAAIRDFGFILTGPDGYFSEEQKDCASDTRAIAPGIPAYEIHNVCKDGRYRIVKEIISDPHRSVLLQRVRISALKGSLSDLRLFALASPRLDDQGHDNDAWIGSYRSWDMLYARHKTRSMALVNSCGWASRSVGYVGDSDPWHDLRQNGRLTWNYTKANHGHVAVCGEIDLCACKGEFVLALSLELTADGAALNAMLSLFNLFESAWDDYVGDWQKWHKQLPSLDDGHASGPKGKEQRDRPDQSRPHVLHEADSPPVSVFRTSMTVLRCHRSKKYLGASLASLAVPWGEVKGDDDSGGYHLVWPRDLSQESKGFLAVGVCGHALETLHYLRATQKPTGGWPQDMWLDGSPHAEGVQMDEAAAPLLLLNLAHREKAVKDSELKTFWPMVRSAAAFIIRSGPVTGQDRWENTPGLSTYTIATEIGALLIAARLADQFGENDIARYFRQTADLWNDLIEPWTYVSGTDLARKLGVEGYYVRIAPSPGMHTIMRRGEKPRMKQAHNLLVEEVVSPDALALVRLGLRAADDPRILNTVKVIDAINRVELPAGPCWHRYNGDYYGEDDQGNPFESKNKEKCKGRAWPLLTGERGHYELAAGNIAQAKKMLETMEGFASQIGHLPEQVWDSDDLPERELFRGRPSGSAMPLAWAHSEYVRLLRSIRDGAIFDRPSDTWERYVDNTAPSDLALWRFDHPVNSFVKGKRMRVEVMEPAVVHFSTDAWRTVRELETHDPGLGFQYADLPTDQMEPGEKLVFTFRWPEAGDRWEGKDFELEVEAAEESPRSPRGKSRQLSFAESHG